MSVPETNTPNPAAQYPDERSVPNAWLVSRFTNYSILNSLLITVIETVPRITFTLHNLFD